MSQLKTLKILLILSACLLAGMVAAFALKPAPQNIQASGQQLGGDFTLTSEEGPVSLSDYKGKVVVLYIGYASCPDVCPTALAVLSQALRNLSPEQSEQVQGIFISVDPERDTPEKLAQYARFFSDRMTGVTGSREQIDAVVRQYGAFYRMVDMKDSALGYAVDHSSRLYLIDRHGALAGTLIHNSTPTELGQWLQRLLEDKES
ncbi:Cytochrome oxidase biogenesis protein Sco1/SenC/PrrC, putative copper metallochaperone [Marinobacterium lacunae]|uniref:Cytochrome oxidase biogenesis protein Sco1/SenC/PrrC, putative copper metallochaperone n=1 Tax=Marinobacterium lacunae TaxID=1232683 RepID=A0A081FWE1_9GAMM|nr:SCO family protein [Marinobacterium lacunae]KEA62846.1 Cytochrome oxidase biogenesis protein Sco1/SenC/PrrC, putative copper metallochaperone [Marinobacterium lacunae]